VKFEFKNQKTEKKGQKQEAWSEDQGSKSKNQDAGTEDTFQTSYFTLRPLSFTLYRFRPGNSPFDMDLLFLGAGMGIVGGLFPSPLHLIALSQASLGRWARGIFILVGPPVVVDGALLIVTFLFYQYIPHNIAHDVAYVGGVALLGFATFALIEMRGKSREEMAQSSKLTYASVSVATLTELTAPGTWIYWLTVAGPIIAEGKQQGYWHVAPFFIGGLVGYYGAAIFAVWLMNWGAGLHKAFKQRLFLVANLLLLVLGISYLIRAYTGK
jgi:threonine/homoserine/homoserine lactone efflux protein